VIYEDFVCTIIYKFEKEGVIDNKTSRGKNFCGKRKLSDISKGSYNYVTDRKK
jgi:hypothetical protein